MALAVPTAAGDIATAQNGSASTVTVNKPSNTADGDLLVAFVTYRNSGTTVTAPSGWTLASSQSATGQSEFVYYKGVPSASGETATDYTWSFTGGSARLGGIVFRVTGANLSSPIDATGTWLGGPTSSIALPSVTAVSSAAMLLEFLLAQNNTTTSCTSTAPGSSTELTELQWNNGSASSDMWVGFELLSAAGATGTRTVTISPSAANGNGAMLTIAPLAGSPPTAAITVTDLNDRTITYNTTGTAGNGGATIATYNIDWGDGTAHGTSASGTHAYAANGNYTVALTVTDSNGLTGTASFNVQVAADLGEVGVGIVALSSGWTQTPSTGATPQEILNDADGGTFLQSPNNPAGSTQTIRMQKLSYAPGQDAAFALVLDRISGTSGSVDVMLKEGATTRATVSGLTPTVGTVGTDVVALVAGTFPAANLTAVTDWGNVSLVPSTSAS